MQFFIIKFINVAEKNDFQSQNSIRLWQWEEYARKKVSHGCMPMMGEEWVCNDAKLIGKHIFEEKFCVFSHVDKFSMRLRIIEKREMFVIALLSRMCDG